MSLGALIFVYLINPVINLLILLVIVQAVLSWLIAFDVINRNNQLVMMIGRFTYAVTSPLLRPLQSVIPSFGGVDVTPIVLFLMLNFIRILLGQWLIGA